MSSMGAFDPQRITPPNGPGAAGMIAPTVDGAVAVPVAVAPILVANAQGDERLTGDVFHRLTDVLH